MNGKGILVRIHHADKRGNVFTLQETFEVRWGDRCVVIPAGFESDGASVPRFFWRSVFPPGDQDALRGAVAHDYVYRNHPPKWSRCEADRMFYDTLTADGVGCIRAFLAWLGVRLFGADAWREGEPL